MGYWGGVGQARGTTANGHLREREPPPLQQPHEYGLDDTICVKVGVLGDCKAGKTSFLVKYVEGQFSDDYVQTLGVDCSEKSYEAHGLKVTISSWDLGGHRQYQSMLPLVCNDADAVIFVFDLTRIASLHSVKHWYLSARQYNKTSVAMLVGTHYDEYVKLPDDDQQLITKQAMAYAQAMEAALVFCSVPLRINVHSVFKVLLARVFDMPCPVQKNLGFGEPLVDY